MFAMVRPTPIDTSTTAPHRSDSSESSAGAAAVVSVDYLTKPMEIFEEMHRVLRPGGKALMSILRRVQTTVY